MQVARYAPALDHVQWIRRIPVPPPTFYNKRCDSDVQPKSFYTILVCHAVLAEIFIYIITAT